MMVTMNNLLTQVNTYSLSSTSTISVPVRPNELVYSQFSHVKGITADSNTPVPLSSLNLLNRLIELRRNMLESKLGTDKQEAREEAKELWKPREELSKELSSVHQEIKSKKENPFDSSQLFQRGLDHPGQLFDIAV